MCFHVLGALVTKCRRRTDPGHDNNARWRLRGYWITCVVMLLLIALLVGLSVLLEYGREHRWSGLKSASRGTTAVPLIVACLVAVCLILELVCVFPTIAELVHAAKGGSVPNGSRSRSPDQGASDEEAYEEPKRDTENPSAPLVGTRYDPSQNVGGEEEEDNEDDDELRPPVEDEEEDHDNCYGEEDDSSSERSWRRRRVDSEQNQHHHFIPTSNA